MIEITGPSAWPDGDAFFARVATGGPNGSTAAGAGNSETARSAVPIPLLSLEMPDVAIASPCVPGGKGRNGLTWTAFGQRLRNSAGNRRKRRRSATSAGAALFASAALVTGATLVTGAARPTGATLLVGAPLFT